MKVNAKNIAQLYIDSFTGLSSEVWLLSLVMLINRAGAMVLPFMALYLTISLGFSMTDSGWVMSAYGLGSILGAFIGGELTDRFNYYFVQLFSLLLSAGLLFLLVILESFFPILLTVFSFSLIADTLRPANSVAIAAYSNEDNRTRSFSLMRLAINLGFSVGPAMGGLIARYMGYKWIFLIDGVTCLTAAFLLYKYLPYKKADHPPKPKLVGIEKGLSPYKDINYLLFIVFVSLFAIIFFQFFTTVPVYFKQSWGINEAQIGLLMTLNGLIIVLFEMPLMQILGKGNRQLRLIPFGFLFLAIGFSFIIVDIFPIIMAIMFIIFISIAEMFAMPFMTNFAISRPAQNRQGQYMALYSIAYGVAYVIGPTLGMQLGNTLGFSMLYILLIILALLGALTFYLSFKKLH